jgi:hypothetical protein
VPAANARRRKVLVLCRPLQLSNTSPVCVTDFVGPTTRIAIAGCGAGSKSGTDRPMTAIDPGLEQIVLANAAALPSQPPRWEAQDGKLDSDSHHPDLSGSHIYILLTTLRNPLPCGASRLSIKHLPPPTLHDRAVTGSLLLVQGKNPPRKDQDRHLDLEALPAYPIVRRLEQIERLSPPLRARPNPPTIILSHR